MRISRRTYIFTQIVLLPLGWLVSGFLALGIWTLDRSFAERDIPQPLRGLELSQSMAQIVALGTAVAALVLIVVFVLVAVRRLHDLGLTGWLLLLWPILIGLIETSSNQTSGVTAMSQVALEAILMMVPGQVGDNDYGPEPIR